MCKDYRDKFYHFPQEIYYENNITFLSTKKKNIILDILLSSNISFLLYPFY